jgi:3-deoxy-D-manno-octulosonic-acid transferase
MGQFPGKQKQKGRNEFLASEARIVTEVWSTNHQRRMRSCYNILFTLLFWLSSPFYFLKMWRRGNWREGFGQRFGRYNSKIKQALTNRHVLWIHAVSVGEVNVCTQLIRALEPRVPNLKIVVSTTTSTGMAELNRRLPSHILRIYYPVDRRRCVLRALSTIHPEVLVLVEAEIWPNFLWRVHDRRIPAFLVNARLSDRSYRGYRRFGFLFRPLFRSFTGVGCQNDLDAARLRTLGCRDEAVHVVGNLKFDAARLEERRQLDVPELLGRLGVSAGAPLLVCGSTHPGEEALLAEVFLRLRAGFPDLFLILVPRHFERGRVVGAELVERGVRFIYRSEVGLRTRMRPGEVQCLLVNTTGELKFFYQHATVIFVGKSLCARGGQNPIEPGALAKPMMFGPHMENFTAIVETFLAREGAVQVSDADDLERQLVRLLADRQLRQRLGQNALQVVRENLGAIEKTVEMILKYLPEEEIYVAPQ